MVFKGTKHEVHSGNTLRMVGSKFNKQYAVHAALIKRTQFIDSENVDLDDGDLQAMNVIYSLNKRRRWLLPKKLKTDLKAVNDCKVSLIEFHKLQRNADCVGYHSNFGRVRKLVPKRTYCDVRCVKQQNSETTSKRAYQRMRKQWRRDLAENPEAEFPNVIHQEPEDPEVTYEVYYPTPSTCSLKYNPKYVVDRDVQIYADLDHNANGKSKKHGNCTKQRAHLQLGLDVHDYTEDVEQDFLEELSNDVEAVNEPDQQPQSAHFTLDALLQSMKPKTKTKKRRKNSENEEYKKGTKDRKIFVGTKEDVVTDDMQGVNIFHDQGLSEPFHYEVQPSLVYITSESVTPEHLQETYGKKCLLAKMTPQRMLLDISSEVRQMLPSQTRKTSDVDIKLVVGIQNSELATKEGIVLAEVYLNGNFKAECVKIETILELELYSLEELVERALKYISTMPEECFQRKGELKVKGACKKNIGSLDLITSVCRWDRCVSTKMPSELCQEMEVAEEGDKALSSANSIRDDDCCNICFTTGRQYSLNSCQHSFCFDCWQSHLVATVDSGRGKITCPEYQCGSIVDKATALSLIGVQLYHRIERLQEQTVFSKNKGQLKWCPNTNCGRVLVASEVDLAASVSVICQCGSSVCWHCLKEPHWPATCREAAGYIAHLRSIGELAPSAPAKVFSVRLTPCPNCNNPIEKNGGCNFMACRCGHSFCWRCLKSYQNCHGNCHGPTKAGKSKPYFMWDVVREDLKDLFAMKTHLLKSGLQHRKHRSHKHVLELQRCVKRIMNTVKYRQCLQEPREPNVACFQEVIATQAKYTTVLMTTVSIYTQLQHILEYTKVALQNTAVKKVVGITGVVERLLFTTSRMEVILTSPNYGHISYIVNRLEFLNAASKQAVTRLACMVRKARASISNAEEQ